MPGFAGIHLADWSRFLALTILFLSLGLLVRTSGQVSLCQVSFMAIGACAFSHLAVDHGWPWGLALLGAGVIAVPIGALLAIPAIRLSGLYLALATFGFGILLQYMFYSQSYMFGNLGLGVRVPMPVFRALGLTQSDKSYYYLCLALAVVVMVFVIAVGRSRLGRLLRALSDSPTGLARPPEVIAENDSDDPEANIVLQVIGQALGSTEQLGDAVGLSERKERPTDIQA